nr:restriction endonuclease [Candidatus Njordarchaeota archaeon]
MIPSYEELMLPLLKLIRDGKEHTMKEVSEKLAKSLNLSDEELAKPIPSGSTSVFAERVGWAKTYMKYAGLMEQPRRGIIRITQRGWNVLEDNPAQINNKYLNRFGEFTMWLQKSQRGRSERSGEGKLGEAEGEHLTPQERMANAHLEMRQALAEDLEGQIKDRSPRFFQWLVADLLVKMGYGKSLSDTRESTKMSRDGGIDGVIKQDKLGLDRVYIQAKKWENQVGRPEVQRFYGVLQDRKASKGIYITTSAFSSDAIDFANRNNIVLIDGDQLVQHMIDHDVGVSRDESYEPYVIKKIDSDYFTEEE